MFSGVHFFPELKGRDKCLRFGLRVSPTQGRGPRVSILSVSVRSLGPRDRGRDETYGTATDLTVYLDVGTSAQNEETPEWRLERF